MLCTRVTYSTAASMRRGRLCAGIFICCRAWREKLKQISKSKTFLCGMRRNGGKPWKIWIQNSRQFSSNILWSLNLEVKHCYITYPHIPPHIYGERGGGHLGVVIPDGWEQPFAWGWIGLSIYRYYYICTSSAGRIWNGKFVRWRHTSII